MKLPCDFDESRMIFSKVFKSRKHTDRSYLFLSYINENSRISIDTPKLTVSQHCSVSDHSDRSILEFDLKGQRHSAVGKLLDLKDLIYNCIQNYLNANGYDGYRILPELDMWKTRINHSGDYETLFFSESSKQKIENAQYIEPPALTAASIKMVAELDGLILDDNLKSVRPVWGTDQVLLYSDSSFNPFGKKYCFIDDDEYLSLEDD